MLTPINDVLSASNVITPEVGVGATILSWSDRFPATIIKVTPKSITVREDSWKRLDPNGMSELQRYEYAPNPDGAEYTFRLTKRGWKDKGGRYLSIGRRERYYDFSF